MSPYSFYFSFKKKKRTKKTYKGGKFYIITHCVERMSDRKINKGEMHVNLHTTPLFKTAVKTDIIGRKSYERYGDNKINTRINPINNNVTTVSRFHTKKYDKLKKGW